MATSPCSLWRAPSESWGPPQQRGVHAAEFIVLLSCNTATCVLHDRGARFRCQIHYGCCVTTQVAYFCVIYISADESLCRRGSGKLAIGVRVDHQRQLLLVLIFDTDDCGPIFLSSVKSPSYLWLKISYSRRHRPIRQSRGAPTVFSECENEDPRCFYHDHFSWALRPRRKHHLCLHKQISSSFYLPCSVIWEFFSHAVVL